MDHALTFITSKLEQHDISYCLCSGTLLGYVRDGRIIPTDKDIDLYIHRKDAGRCVRMLRGYPIYFAFITDEFATCVTHGAAIDLFYYDVSGSDVLDLAFGFTFPASWILPIQKTPTIPFYAPVDPIPYLTLIYGPRWQTPMTEEEYTYTVRDKQYIVTYTDPL